MSLLFLTSEEIVELTGYKRPGCQIRKLREYGVRFFVAADGHPRVLKSDLESKDNQTVIQPDFDALEKVVNLR